MAKLNSEKNKILQLHGDLENQINPESIILFKGIEEDTKVMTLKDITEFIKQRKILEDNLNELENIIRQSVLLIHDLERQIKENVSLFTTV